MKKTIFIISLALAVAFVLSPVAVQSQPGRGGYGYGMGPGYGYGMGPGMMGGWDGVDIPSKLPAPKSTEWVQKLREILTLEKQSLTQYQADQEKFNAYMPYMMVIPRKRIISSGSGNCLKLMICLRMGRQPRSWKIRH